MRFLYALFLYVLWPFIYPFVRFLTPVFSKRLARRIVFELKNFSSDWSQSFKLVGIQADICFEVSSEGELEQILPLLHSWLKREKKVELVYCSESVEAKIQNLAQMHYPNIRVFRLPLISYMPGKHSLSRWMSAKKLILCRYDFFPELMWLGAGRKMRFILVWATLMNKKEAIKDPSSLVARWWRWQLQLFDGIVPATQKDRQRLEELGGLKNLWPELDLRVLQIHKRLKKSRGEWAALTIVRQLENLWRDYPLEHRLIVGNCWPVDMPLLDRVSVRENFILIVPHKLDQHFYTQISEQAKACLESQDVYVITAKTDLDSLELQEKFKQRPGAIVLAVGGILCELYQFFGHAFVGGGHGRSVHSLLEPFLAGCHVYHGPKVHRSTEYELIQSIAPHEIHQVDHLAQFNSLFNSYQSVAIGPELRQRLIEKQTTDYIELESRLLAD